MRKQLAFALYRQRTASTNGMRVCILSFVSATSTPVSHLVSEFTLKKMLRLVFVVVLALFAYAQGESCDSPKLTVSSYSTRDARLTAEPVAQLEFTVKCKSGKQVSFNVHFIGIRPTVRFSQVPSMPISMIKLFHALNHRNHLANTT